MPKKQKGIDIPKDIRDLARRFRDHEGVTVRNVQGWVGQWNPGDADLAKRVLTNTHFYSAADIRAMLQQMVDKIYRELPGVPRNKIIFVPAGKPYSGAAILGRALRDMKGVRKNQIKSLPELLELPEKNVAAAVFIEDFSGTGGTLESWWYTVEPLVLPKVSTIIFGILVLNSIARPKLEQFTARVLAVEEFGVGENVLSPDSTAFSQPEKDLLLGYCERTKCSPEYVRGFGDCGLLIAFKHFCPNNCLPILWHGSGNQWKNLFKRTAI